MTAISPAWCRWSWLGLIAVQPVWFLAVNPPRLFEPWLVLAIWLAPLLAPAWWLLQLKPRALVFGGAILLFHFSLAVAEAWAAPAARGIALFQIALITVYYLGLVALRRQPRGAAN